MPFKSRSQQRFMFAAESRGELPKGTAHRWADHTPDIKSLPEKVDSEEREKSAGPADWLARISGKAPSTYNATSSIGKTLESVLPSSIGKSQAGRIGGGLAFAGGGSLAGVHTMSHALSGGAGNSGTAPAAAATPEAAAHSGPGVNTPAPEPATPGIGEKIRALMPNVSNEDLQKYLLLAGGGLAAGTAGAYGISRLRRKNPTPKFAGDRVMLPAPVRTLLIKKAAQMLKRASAAKLCSFIDTVCAHMPVEKTASLRIIQAGVAGGLPLSYAIKTAYPTISPEMRGVVALKLVKAAADASMDANYGGAGATIGGIGGGVAGTVGGAGAGALLGDHLANLGGKNGKARSLARRILGAGLGGTVGSLAGSVGGALTGAVGGAGVGLGISRLKQAEIVTSPTPFKSTEKKEWNGPIASGTKQLKKMSKDKEASLFNPYTEQTPGMVGGIAGGIAGNVGGMGAGALLGDHIANLGGEDGKPRSTTRRVLGAGLGGLTGMAAGGALAQIAGILAGRGVDAATH